MSVFFPLGRKSGTFSGRRLQSLEAGARPHVRPVRHGRQQVPPPRRRLCLERLARNRMARPGFLLNAARQQERLPWQGVPGKLI